MKRVWMAILMVALSLGSANAQEPAQEKEKARAESVTPRPESGQAVNVRVDLTLSEQTGSAPPMVKTMSILAADNHSGRIRSVNPTGGARGSELNADVRPRLLEGDRLQLALTLEYRPVGFVVKEGEPDRPNLTESLTVILQNGKPLVISESADPNSDRKVKLEVRATVLR